MSTEATPASSMLTKRAQRLEGSWPRNRPLVMGILNCTPDSFSDGGRYLLPDRATAHADALLEDGADIVDIGGESTRPGAGAIPAEEELRRTLPVVEAVRERHPDALISIDTCKAAVAAEALAAGADIVNDVSGGAGQGTLSAVARAGAAVVLMHMRGSPRTMQDDTRYVHVVAEVHADLMHSAERARECGVARDRIWLDPGIGFGKDDGGNLALLAALPELAARGYPVLVGPSRKSFIGRICGAPVEQRLAGSLAALLPVLGLPRAIVRVHEPRPVRQFLEIARRLDRAVQ